MTVEAAVLSFYLLFPLWNARQEMLAPAAKKEVLAAAQKKETVAELKDFLSGRHSVDLAGWEISARVPRLMDEIGLGAAEVLWKDKDGGLRLLEYGVERFAADGGKNETQTVVSVNDKHFVQTVYDKDYRIAEKSVWRNSQDPGAVKLLRRSSYSYNAAGSGTLPTSVTEEFLEDKKVVTSNFTATGKVSSVRTYVVLKSGRRLVQQDSYTYDREQRLASEENISYASSGAKQQVTRSTYAYTKKSSHPDTKYYEDGVLRIETNYLAEEKYCVTTYFDRNYSVSATFENGKKLSEVMYVNGVKQRERTFND